MDEGRALWDFGYTDMSGDWQNVFLTLGPFLVELCFRCNSLYRNLYGSPKSYKSLNSDYFKGDIHRIISLNSKFHKRIKYYLICKNYIYIQPFKNTSLYKVTDVFRCDFISFQQQNFCQRNLYFLDSKFIFSCLVIPIHVKKINPKVTANPIDMPSLAECFLYVIILP